MKISFKNLKYLFFLILSINFIFLNKANSYEISDKFYGSLNAGIGYQYKNYVNAGKKVNGRDFFNGGSNIDIFSAIDAFNEFEYNGVLRKQKQHNYFFFSIWNNLYYKLTDRVHPFIGVQANVYVPIEDTKFMENNLTCALGQIFVKDLFTLNFLIGTKFVLNSKHEISISPYGFVGMGVVYVKQIRDKHYPGFKTDGYNAGDLANTDLGYNRYNYISFNTGAGLDLQIKKIIIGAEYKYSTYKSGVGDLYSETGFKVVNHNFSVKIGYQFL